MKPFLFGCAILLMLAHRAAAQKGAGDYFDDGVKAMQQQDFAGAQRAFHYITTHHPRNGLYPRVFFNTGCIYYQQKAWDSATAVFKQILRSGFNEKEQLGGGIMADPYTNYCHHSAELLSEIYLSQKRYDSSLRYLAMADTLFPYLHFCGNELAANSIHLAMQYATLHQKLDNKDAAVKALLPVMFMDGLADNSGAISQLKKLLQSRGDRHVKDSLDAALNAMSERTTTHGQYTYTDFYYTFMGQEFRAPSESRDSSQPDKASAIAGVKKTAFYKMISEL